MENFVKIVKTRKRPLIIVKPLNPANILPTCHINTCNSTRLHQVQDNHYFHKQKKGTAAPLSLNTLNESDKIKQRRTPHHRIRLLTRRILRLHHGKIGNR